MQIPGASSFNQVLGEGLFEETVVYGEIEQWEKPGRCWKESSCQRDTMCKGPEAKKSSGYLRRRRKFPVNGKQGREWKRNSESKPDHTGLWGTWPRIWIYSMCTIWKPEVSGTNMV